MPKKSFDVRTARSGPEVAASIESCLKAQGFDRTGSRNKYIWRKGLIWPVFASARVTGGVAHLEVWNYVPIPGMGSFLMYFLNRGRLPDILESIERASAGGDVAGEAITEPEAATVELRYAGFWMRFGATLIDAFLIYVAVAIPSAILFGLTSAVLGVSSISGSGVRLMVTNILTLILVVGSWLYFALLESSSGQATLGKKALGMKVTDDRGERISFGKASVRFWSKWVSLLTVGIGFLLAAFTGKKQALHDMMARTLVVRR
ncbi:MAG: RDD family protein [Spirochaetes bacterium]|nr:RDD family protein [Spirochaetota bacterium]